MASAQQTLPTPEAAGSASPFTRRGRRGYTTYLLLACVLPLLGYLAAFPLVCSRWYERWSETQWGPELEYPFVPDTPNADVVIFGDSSAFLGIDPRLVNRELGIRSIVLPGTVGSLPVIRDTPLRFYLAHHRPPKLIVLYFSAWNLDFEHVAKVRFFEGEEIMMRHASWGEIARFTLHHPLEIAEFPLRLYSTFGPKMVKGMLHGEDRAHEIAQALGHAPYTEKIAPLTDLCQMPASLSKQHSDASVAELRQRYTTPETAVMLYLAPIPACTNSTPASQYIDASLGAAPPVLLPPTYFSADTYYAHIRPPSVPLATQVFTDALRKRLAQVDPALLSNGAPATTP